MITWLLLGECSEVITSEASSYGTTAAARTSKSAIVCNHHKFCFRRLSPTPCQGKKKTEKKNNFLFCCGSFKKKKQQKIRNGMLTNQLIAFHLRRNIHTNLWAPQKIVADITNGWFILLQNTKVTIGLIRCNIYK